MPKGSLGRAGSKWSKCKWTQRKNIVIDTTIFNWNISFLKVLLSLNLPKEKWKMLSCDWHRHFN